MINKIDPVRLVEFVEKIIKSEFPNRLKRLRISEIIAEIGDNKILFWAVVQSINYNIDVFQYEVSRFDGTYSWKFVRRYDNFEYAKKVCDRIVAQKIDEKIYWIVAGPFERTFHPDPEKPLTVEDYGYVIF